MNADYEDSKPLSREWLESIFTDETINGHCILIDGDDGHPIELFLAEDMVVIGVYRAHMMQSDPPDTISITGRVFKTRGDVRLLLAALGYIIR